jgi:phosphoribosyl 1,2-cyclic phosphate phosphodiesterase
MRIRVLGCGASSGTPLINGDWCGASSLNPKNLRTRCSAALHIGEKIWLIDTSPDLRSQCLREGIQRVDGVLCTHAHFDHIGGLEELKSMASAQGQKIPFYSDQTTLDALMQRCPYVFEGSGSYRPFLDPVLIDGPFFVEGIPVIPFQQDHRYSHTLGFRFPQWAYSTDVWALDDAAFSVLKELDLWFVDCLGIAPQPHWTHSHLQQTLEWIRRAEPKRSVLIHMSCLVDYDTFSGLLPPSVMAAYDGLILDI